LDAQNCGSVFKKAHAFSWCRVGPQLGEVGHEKG
jgi:hypothetical protein